MTHSDKKATGIVSPLPYLKAIAVIALCAVTVVCSIIGAMILSIGYFAMLVCERIEPGRKKSPQVAP